MQHLSIISGTLAVFLWGISFVAIKIALPEMKPETMIFIRQFLGVLTIGTVVTVRRRLTIPDRTLIPGFIGTSFVGIVLHQWFQAQGMVTVTAMVSSWLSALAPILIAVMSWIFLREKFFPMSLIWLIIAGFGAVLISSGSWQSLMMGNYGGEGSMLVLASACLWALYSIMLKKILVNNDVSTTTFIVLLLGLIMLIPIFVYEKGWVDVVNISMKGWFSLVILGIGSTGLASIFYNYALKNASGTMAASLQYPEPLITMLGATLLLKERFTMSMLVGGILILLSILSIQRLESYDQGSRLAN